MAAKCLIDDKHPLLGIENHDAIGAVFDDRCQTATLSFELMIELGIANSDSRLVGESLQKLRIHLCEGIFAPKQIDHTQQFVLEEQRDTHDLSQRTAQLFFHQPHTFLKIDDVRFDCVLVGLSLVTSSSICT